MKDFRELLKKEIGWAVAIIMGAIAVVSFFLKIPNQNKNDITKNEIAIFEINKTLVNLRDNHIHTLQSDVDELQGDMTNARVEIGQVKVLVEQLLKK